MSKAFDRVLAAITAPTVVTELTTRQLADAARVSVPTAKKHALALCASGVVRGRNVPITFRHNPWNYDPDMRQGVYSRTPVCDTWWPIRTATGQYRAKANGR